MAEKRVCPTGQTLFSFTGYHESEISSPFISVRWFADIPHIGAADLLLLRARYTGAVPSDPEPEAT